MSDTQEAKPLGLSDLYGALKGVSTWEKFYAVSEQFFSGLYHKLSGPNATDVPVRGAHLIATARAVAYEELHQTITTLQSQLREAVLVGAHRKAQELVLWVVAASNFKCSGEVYLTWKQEWLATCEVERNVSPAARALLDEVEGLRKEVRDLIEHLKDASEIIKVHVPEDALGVNGVGDPSVPGGYTSWPIKAEYLDKFKMAIERKRAAEAALRELKK